MTASRYYEGIDKAVLWLLSQQKPDGSIGSEVPAFYKLPAALEISGHSIEAQRLVNWMRDNFFTKDGDFKVERYVKPYVESRFHIYHNHWIVIGTQRLGRFDISHRAINFILNYQDPKLGGFFYERPGPEGGEEDILTTSFCGLACLYTGRLQNAVKAGNFLRMIADAQPDVKNNLYVNYHSKQGLVTEFPDEEAPVYTVATGKPEQLYYYAGVAVAFLAKLYGATGKDEYLDLARQYFDFATSCYCDVLCFPASGKLGWGAAYLYEVTSEEKHKHVAESLLDYFFKTQSQNGSWPVEGFSYLKVKDEPERQYSIRVDVTAELCIIWPIEIMKAIA